MRSTRPISSAKALELGLVSEEVDGDLVGRAVQIAKDLASGVRPRQQRRQAAGERLDVVGHFAKRGPDRRRSEALAAVPWEGGAEGHRFASNSARATGGQTLFPIKRTWSVRVMRAPSAPVAIS